MDARSSFPSPCLPIISSEELEDTVEDGLQVSGRGLYFYAERFK
jgi:hypothetical protein